jgi:putative transposase
LKISRFSEAKIVGILKELEAGTPATALAQKHGRHPNTIRLWRDKYAGLETSDLVRLKQLEAEHMQMQRIIARQTLEIDAMRNLILASAPSCSHRFLWRLGDFVGSEELLGCAIAQRAV